MQQPPYKSGYNQGNDYYINNHINVIIQAHGIKRSQEQIYKGTQKIVHKSTSLLNLGIRKAGRSLLILILQHMQHITRYDRYASGTQ